MPAAKSVAVPDEVAKAETTGGEPTDLELYTVLHRVRQLVNDTDGTDKVFVAGDIFDPSKLHFEDPAEVGRIVAYCLAGQDHNGPIIRKATNDEAKAYADSEGK